MRFFAVSGELLGPSRCSWLFGEGKVRDGSTWDGQSLAFPPKPSYLCASGFRMWYSRTRVYIIRHATIQGPNMSNRTRMPSPPRLALTPSEAAQSIGCSRDFFDKHVGAELRWVRRGRLKFVALSEIEDWPRRNAALTTNAPAASKTMRRSIKTRVSGGRRRIAWASVLWPDRSEPVGVLPSEAKRAGPVKLTYPLRNEYRARASRPSMKMLSVYQSSTRDRPEPGGQARTATTSR